MAPTISAREKESHCEISLFLQDAACRILRNTMDLSRLSHFSLILGEPGLICL